MRRTFGSAASGLVKLDGSTCRGTLPMALITRSSSAALPINPLTRAVVAEISASICRRCASKSAAGIVPTQLPPPGIRP